MEIHAVASQRNCSRDVGKLAQSFPSCWSFIWSSSKQLSDSLVRGQLTIDGKAHFTQPQANSSRDTAPCKSDVTSKHVFRKGSKISPIDSSACHLHLFRSPRLQVMMRCQIGPPALLHNLLLVAIRTVEHIPQSGPLWSCRRLRTWQTRPAIQPPLPLSESCTLFN